MKLPLKLGRSRLSRFFQKAVFTALLAPLLFLSLPFAAANAATVALVTRTIPIPEADKPYLDHLNSRGWDVTLVDDDSIRDDGKNAIAGFDLVVISSTVFTGRIEGRLRSAPEPILVSNHNLFPWFHFTSFNNNDSGFTTASARVNIVNPFSPLVGGRNGLVDVGTLAKPMNFADLGPGVHVAATAKDNPDQAVIFAYGAGTTLASGEIAAGRRVGYYLSQAAPRFANSEAWSLFDASAKWLAPNAPEPGAPTPPPAPTQPTTPPAPAPSPTTTFTGIAPNNGTLLGANVSNEGNGSRYDAVLAFQDSIGRDIAIINRFHEFSAGLQSRFFWDRQHIADGRTVMVSWRATDNPGSVNGTPDPQRANKIVNGQFNSQIDAMANALRDLGAPVLLRFNWEMDQDVGDPQYIGTPAQFIAAWRYVHNRFQQRGATNVEWVWAPRARSFAKDVGPTYYPGTDYVDWIGGSAVPINSFTDAQTIYSSWNEWAINMGKPQLLWIGLLENPNDSQWKANFIDELRMLAAGEWVGVKALIYYNSNSPLGNDYTIDTSNQSFQAYRRMACDPHFEVTDSC